MSGLPFHRCTHTALAPEWRHLRVRRLRQCAAVHRYTPDGKLCPPGASPAPVPGSSTSCITSAATPMAMSTSRTARIIASRFSTLSGKYETEWHDLYRPVRPVHVLYRSPEPLLRRGACARSGVQQPRLARSWAARSAFSMPAVDCSRGSETMAAGALRARSSRHTGSRSTRQVRSTSRNCRMR